MFSATTKDYANATKESAAEDIRETAAKTKRAAYDAADKTEDSVAGAAEQAGRKVRDFVDEATDKVQSTTNKLNDEVQQNPIQSVLIAAGVGFVLGMLFRR